MLKEIAALSKLARATVKANKTLERQLAAANAKIAKLEGKAAAKPAKPGRTVKVKAPTKVAPQVAAKAAVVKTAKVAKAPKAAPAKAAKAPKAAAKAAPAKTAKAAKAPKAAAAKAPKAAAAKGGDFLL